MIDARLKVRLLWTIFHHESMYKTRNLFRANGSKRVPGFCLDGKPCGARSFLSSGISCHAVLGGVVVFHQGDVVFRVVAECRT